MKILLTGASGLVGKSLARTWRSLPEIELTTLSRSSLPVENHIAHDLLYPLKTDLSFDAVVHSAALVDESATSNEDLIFKNLSMARHTAQIAKHCGAKSFLNISSSSVYGTHRTGRISESSDLRPKSYYALSKKMSEELIDFEISSDLPVSHLRLGYVLSNPLPDRYFMMRIWNNIVQNKSIVLTDPELTRFSFIDSSDIEKVAMKILTLNLSGVFNLASDQFPNLLEVFQYLSKLSERAVSYEIVNQGSAGLGIDLANEKIKVALGIKQFKDWKQSLVFLGGAAQ